jgi:hypothetical protein
MQQRRLTASNQLTYLLAETLSETGEQVKGDDDKGPVGLVDLIRVVLEHLILGETSLDYLQASLEDRLGERRKGRTSGDGDRRQALNLQLAIGQRQEITNLQQGNKIRIIIRELEPTVDQGWHEDVKVDRSTQSWSDRVGQCSEGIVENKQILLLVLVESERKVAQDWLEEWHKLSASLLFQGCESAAPGFLNSLVSVKDHAQQLDVSHWPDK